MSSICLTLEMYRFYVVLDIATSCSIPPFAIVTCKSQLSYSMPNANCHRGEYWDTAIPSGDIMRPEKIEKEKRKRDKTRIYERVGEPQYSGIDCQIQGVGTTGASVLCYRLRDWVMGSIQYVSYNLSSFILLIHVNWEQQTDGLILDTYYDMH